MKINTISAGNFRRILPRVEDWSPEFRAHLHSLANKLDATHRAYVAVAGRQVIGFMLYSVSKRRNQTTINVDLTSVDPLHRNKGVSTALKLHLAQHHRSATITSEVDPKNMPSVAVNLNLGATAIGHTMTMNPTVMLQRAAERRHVVRPPTRQHQKALEKIRKERHIKEHGCPPGKSRVKGYRRKDGVRVATYCRTLRG